MMRNFIIKSKPLNIGGILMGGVLFAQVQINQQIEFGTALYDINNEGKAVHGNGYYDFTTNTSSLVESGVAQTVAITNSNIVVGLIDSDNGGYLPASRIDGVWNAYPENAFNPNEEYTIYSISENGRYVVGQKAWTVEGSSWGFIYNTETEVYTLLSNELYESGAAYAVNDNGIAVGWVGALDSGTRMPAYFTENGNIELIYEGNGEANGINNNNVIVGAYESQGFIYDISTDEFFSFSPWSDYHGLVFSDISENNVVIGYVMYFDPIQGFLRNPIIYSTQIDQSVMLISDLLDNLGVSYDADIFEGQAYRVSRDGRYISGWGNGPAFVAMGWAIYWDDLFEDLGLSDRIDSDFIYYPNPVKNKLNFNSKKLIESVEVFSLTGQKVMSNSQVSNAQVDVGSLPIGTYVFKVILEGGQIETFKILKK